ncbi:MAG: CHASE2 domain-containing protein [Pseudanabaenales cyanobacterium]|nr:CHASE2 domain-containing protein [Pseudanabaenales cyanobacterium]
MRLRLRSLMGKGLSILLIAPGVASLVLAANFTGIFQLSEWIVLDHFFRLRPEESNVPRVVVVTIDEADLHQVGKWPIPDAVLAELIDKLKRHQPRVIGLDLYRDLPVDPGHQDLIEVFKSTPNLIGVEKANGNPDRETVKPPPTLASRNQVGLADLILDEDGKVRRGLLSIRLEGDHQIKLGLAAKLALAYLEQEGIRLQEADDTGRRWKLGRSIFKRFEKNDGGYVNADTGGYQILMNYRGLPRNFETVSMTEVLEDTLQAEQVRDRIILIGAVATSLNDLYYTPYDNSQRTAGVFIHANLISQIVSAALDGRPLLQVWPELLEWLWTLAWSGVGATASWALLQTRLLGKTIDSGYSMVGTALIGGGLIVISYLLFLGGRWVPVAPPLLALTTSSMMSVMIHTQQLQKLASSDGLTQIANRRYFDQYLAQKLTEQKKLSLILCDVDYFKLYNDTYGHQAGDVCLQQVANALRNSVRQFDLVARYGGEEFVVVLPNTDAQKALYIAERIQFKVRSLEIPHKSSRVSQFLTLSCGVAGCPPQSKISSTELIEAADQALYVAKQAGRNRTAVANINQSKP